MRDYDAVDSGAKDGEAAISVWVGRSKEWAEVLKRLVDDDFTPQSGIAVEMNIVPASQLGSGTVNALMLSIISEPPGCGIGERRVTGGAGNTQRSGRSQRFGRVRHVSKTFARNIDAVSIRRRHLRPA